MQLLDISRTGAVWRTPPPLKRRRDVIQCRTLPRADLVGMHVVLLRQLRQGQLLTERFKRYTRLEIRRMVLSPLHLGSSFSSVDRPEQLIRNLATTSLPVSHHSRHNSHILVIGPDIKAR